MGGVCSTRVMINTCKILFKRPEGNVPQGRGS
jgi:hypothetical protein